MDKKENINYINLYFSLFVFNLDFTFIMRKQVIPLEDIEKKLDKRCCKENVLPFNFIDTV